MCDKMLNDEEREGTIFSKILDKATGAIFSKLLDDMERGSFIVKVKLARILVPCQKRR